MNITLRIAKCLTNQEIKAKCVKPDSLFGRFIVGEIYDAYYNAPSIYTRSSSFDVFDGNCKCNFYWEEFFKYFDIEGDFDGVENVSRIMEAEAFFPELKESENERVRKGLVKAVSGTFEGSKLYGTDVTREEALAWLEKQGEKDKIESLRTEYEEGRADVLRCIDPDEMVADFCSQPLSKTRSIASVYRQGIIDILKRINSNEENSITGTCSIDNCGL